MTQSVYDPNALINIVAMGREGQCRECGTFRADGKPPTSHRFFCSQYVDLGVIRWNGVEPQVERRHRDRSRR